MSKIKSFCHVAAARDQYNKDHAHSPVRTQKGQRSQTVSTALSVAFVALQLYIMKNFSIVVPIYDIRMGG